MDLFFPDPNDPPLSPEAVCLRSLRAEPRPDALRVKVFLELTPFQERPSAEIMLPGPDGSEIDYSPVWSPDGAWIAFRAHHDAPADIYLIKPDGTGLVNLTQDPADDEMPYWK